MTARQGFTSPCKGEVGREAAGRGSKRRFSRTEAVTKRARRLRAETTDAEAKLWHALRRNQLNKLIFRRQHPIGTYTLDFYCPSLRLAIEVDGGQHGGDRELRRDENHTIWLKSKGIAVIRFWNNDVRTNLNDVLEKNAQVASQRRALTPSPTLPLSGGGRKGAVP